MDGITSGHNCQIPLTTSQDCYCVTHCGLSNICTIKNCNEPVLEGKRACIHPEHQNIECVYILWGQSRVQLQEKLKCQHVSHPNDGITKEVEIGELIDDDIEEEEFEVDGQDPNLVHGINEGVSDLHGTSPPQTSSPTKKRISAQFGRQRTHNEQILVAPCGMILVHETFHGAEAIATCAVSQLGGLLA